MLMSHLLGGHGNKSCCWTTVGIMRERGDDVKARLMRPFLEALQGGGGGVINQKETSDLHHFLFINGVFVSLKHSDVLINYKPSCCHKAVPTVLKMHQCTPHEWYPFSGDHDPAMRHMSHFACLHPLLSSRCLFPFGLISVQVHKWDDRQRHARPEHEEKPRCNQPLN